MRISLRQERLKGSLARIIQNGAAGCLSAYSAHALLDMATAEALQASSMHDIEEAPIEAAIRRNILGANKPAPSEATEGVPSGATDGQPCGTTEGAAEGLPEGAAEGLPEGAAESATSKAPAITRVRARPAHWRVWQHQYIDLISLLRGISSLTCSSVGVSPDTLKSYRSADPVFDLHCREAEQEARKQAAEVVEAALHVSAVLGDTRPVYQGGVLVGQERRKSVQAAQALLSAHDPAKWRGQAEQPTIAIQLPPADAVRAAMSRLLAPEPPAIETAVIETAQPPPP